MTHILVVEDESIIRQSVKRLLERNQLQVTDVDSLTAARDLDFSQFDLIITDLRLPGGQGTELIKLASGKPVLVITSYASMRSAVDAMKLGAADYIAKPFDHEELMQAVQKLLAQNAVPRPVAASAPLPQAQVSSEDNMVGSSPAMRTLLNKISKVAPTDATVLILGESGTGKELVAKAIHHQSKRAAENLISVNCAAIAESLIESELFGHEKGAFTGAASQRQGLIEAANNGTLFLDEIGELPLEAQARLLRVLQESEIRRVGSTQSISVNVRLLAATHRDLKNLVAQGEFRQDLYYRLNVVELNLPPLRERGDDVLLIAQALLQRHCTRMGISAMQFQPQALELIQQYNWPGNIRELENALERAIILADAQQILPEHLDIQTDSQIDHYVNAHFTPMFDQAQTSSSPAVHHDLSLDDYFIRFVMENEQSMTETDLAKKLGISRKNLWERRQKLGIPRKKNQK